MAKYRILKNADTGVMLLNRLEWGDNFWLKFAGLMLRHDLPEDEGLIFVYHHENIVETSIHMFFMNFAIATIWLDKDARVVDKVLAKPWRPMYASHKPAQYVIEARPTLLDKVAIGDRLAFE
jgi:uncharacterized membrane protein (UPF0127 family)